MNKIITAALAVIIILTAVSACAKGSRPVDSRDLAQSPFASFRDIPGITEREISDIEALKKEHDTFIYAMTLSTEAFLKESDENGEVGESAVGESAVGESAVGESAVGESAVGGYAALFCEWLTDLFGIRFKPEIFVWSDLVEKLNAGEIDFAGNLTPTPERRKIYHMTDPVAERQYKTIQLAGSPPLNRIALTRPLRYVFIEGAAIAGTVASVTESGAYEAMFVNNYEEAYRALESGTADAFIGDSAVILSFDAYGDVYADDFLPLIFSSVSMATAKDEFASVISVITKAQRNGAIPYLNNLFNKGYQAYKKNKFFMQLSEAERMYLKNSSSIPMAARYFNYPIDFYNTYEKKWAGLAFDVLREIEELTGLTFTVVNNNNTNLSELYEMVRVGEAYLVPELLISNERKEHYIWTERKFITDQYALISKSRLPNVSANEISNMRVGLIKDTVRAGLFHTWFPNAANVREYDTDENAMFAAERGEVDMVMSSKNRMISYLNYYGLSDYKANYLFNYPYEATFGFNKNQAVLCSIVDKALSHIDTYVITEQWMTKTYDYKTKLMEAQRPWLIGAIVLFSTVLALVLVMFNRNRKYGKRLKKLFREVSEANRVKNISINIMENILNSIDTMIYVSDPQTNEILFINDNMKRQFNIEGDCTGQLCYKLLQKNMDKRCDFCPCIRLDKEPDKAVVWDERNSLTNLIYHNTDRYIDWSDGKTVHIQHSVDMTELIAAKEFAEQSSRYKSNFLATVSHEIRTPMNAILGISEIQLQAGALSPDTEEAFKKIYESGDLLLYIINDILDLSKIEAGKLDLTPVKYNLLNMINDTTQLNSMRYESKHLLFTIHIDENTPLELFGDELRIKQVLNNVLSNSYKYTNTGKIEFSVFSELIPDDHMGNVMLVFRISDTGQGMTEYQVKKLFDEYTRFNTEANRSTVGVGIGMNIVKRLIDMMGGSIDVQSEPDKGSVFTVRIPQKLAGHDVCGPESPDRLRALSSQNTSMLERAQLTREYMPYGSVLVVDDVETNLYVVNGMLDIYGLKIEMVSSGFDAIEKIKSGDVYDIIFMDHMMPKMDGIETVKRIRSMGYSNSIIALTADALAGRDKMFFENGFDRYISKPVDLHELNLVLNEFIRDKKPPDVVEAARKEQHDKEQENNVSGQNVAKESGVDNILAIDIKKAIKILEDLYARIHNLDEDGIDQFNVTVHGMKSALSNIGEKELYSKARKLEKAGINLNFDYLYTETPVLINGLKSLIANLKPGNKS